MSIIRLIIIEAIFITTSAGYIGMFLGMGVMELVGYAISQGSSEGGITMFLDPSVNMGVVIGATLLLIVCGVVAGLIPSLKAVKVKPIEAMRAE